MIRVVVSAVGLVERRTGVERYALEFLRALIGRPPPGHEVVPVVREWLAEESGIDRTSAIRVPDAAPAPAAIEVGLPLAQRRVRPHVTHALDLCPPRRSRSALVQTIHDSLLLDPSTALATRGARLYYGPNLRSAVRSGRVDALVTTSSAARDAILARVGGRTPVWALGAAPFSLPATPAGRVVPRRGISVLSVGTVEPRKSLDTLAVAVDLLRTAGTEVTWWHVGRQGWGRVPDQSRHLGVVDDQRLSALLAATDVFVSTSIDEGYNMAAAEAVAAGVRCVLTDIPAHRESYGHVATLVPVRRPEALATAIRAVAAQPAPSHQKAPGSTWSSVVAGAALVWEEVRR